MERKADLSVRSLLACPEKSDTTKPNPSFAESPRRGHRTDRMCDAQLEIMKEANEVEKLSAKNSSYADCFRGNNLRRTVIGVACWLIQIWAGGGVGSYATVL